MGFGDKEFRREFCMFAALAVGAAGLVIASLNLSHNLGYWPHGQSLASAGGASQEQSNKAGKPEDLKPEGNVMQFIIFCLMIGSMLTVAVLYYRGRKISTGSPPKLSGKGAVDSGKTQAVMAGFKGDLQRVVFRTQGADGFSFTTGGEGKCEIVLMRNPAKIHLVSPIQCDISDTDLPVDISTPQGTIAIAHFSETG